MVLSRVLTEMVRLASSNLGRQKNQVEKVIEVLVPGPLGIVENKFTRNEVDGARDEAASARKKWRRASSRKSPILRL